MSTVSDTIDIIEAFIVGAVPTATISPRYEDKIDPSRLPTFIILPQGASRERISARNYNTTRDYLILMLIALVFDDKPQQQQEAREAGYVYLDTIPDYIEAHPMLGDTTYGIIVASTLPREEGVQMTSWAGDQFSAIPFRISVTTSKGVS